MTTLIGKCNRLFIDRLSLHRHFLKPLSCFTAHSPKVDPESSPVPYVFSLTKEYEFSQETPLGKRSVATLIGSVASLLVMQNHQLSNCNVQCADDQIQDYNNICNGDIPTFNGNTHQTHNNARSGDVGSYGGMLDMTQISGMQYYSSLVSIYMISSFIFFICSQPNLSFSLTD